MIIKVPLRPYYIGTKGGNTKCSHRCGTPKTTNSAPTVQHTQYGNLATRCHEVQNPSNVLHHSAARIYLAAKVVMHDVLDPQIPWDLQVSEDSKLPLSLLLRKSDYLYGGDEGTKEDDLYNHLKSLQR